MENETAIEKGRLFTRPIFNLYVDKGSGMARLFGRKRTLAAWVVIVESALALLAWGTWLFLSK
jgi:hypothetical protein